MSDENKAVVRRYYREVWERGDLRVVDEIFAADVELHMAGIPEDPFGPAPVKQLAAMARTAFPGLRVTIEDLIVEHDKVVATVSLHGPHDGTTQGVSPQEATAIWRRIDVFRLHRGLIVEHWSDRDDHALLQRLGIAPPLTPPPREA